MMFRGGARRPRRSGWTRLLAAVLAPVLLCAWTYPEHRDISAAALERLTPARQDVLARMWTMATGGPSH